MSGSVAEAFVFWGRETETQGRMDSTQITVLVAAVTNSLALAGCYYGLKADNASLAAKLDKAMLQERLDRQGENNTLHGICSKLESTIKELTNRLGTLENGQDEWTQALRKRTHELADQLNVLALKVDRLERPAGYGQP
jgi:predicted nuclease with TOPRIM domain